MTTQVLPLFDPARGAFWAWVAPLVAILIVAGAALADRVLEPRRDPADVMAVYSLGSARRALARVDRLDLQSTAAGAAAFRHLTAVKTWAASSRHVGTRRHQAAVNDVLDQARAQLAALGRGPVAAREPRDGALVGPGRYVDGRVPGAPDVEAMLRAEK